MSTKPDPKKSLDLEEDYPVSPEWLEEIRRRCAEIDSGKTTLLDGAMVINELRGEDAQSGCDAKRAVRSR